MLKQDFFRGTRGEHLEVTLLQKVLVLAQFGCFRGDFRIFRFSGFQILGAADRGSETQVIRKSDLKFGLSPVLGASFSGSGFV